MSCLTDCNICDNRENELIIINKKNRRIHGKDDNNNEKKATSLDINDVLNCFFSLNVQTPIEKGSSNILYTIMEFFKDCLDPNGEENLFKKKLKCDEDDYCAIECCYEAFKQLIGSSNSKYHINITGLSSFFYTIKQYLESLDGFIHNIEQMLKHNINDSAIYDVCCAVMTLYETFVSGTKNFHKSKTYEQHFNKVINEKNNEDKIKSLLSYLKEIKEKHKEYKEKFADSLDSIQKCITYVCDNILPHNNKQDITIKDFNNLLIKKCLSLEDNFDYFIEILKYGYLDKNNKRKFLDIYQFSVLIKHIPDFSKRIIKDNLSIMYNTQPLYEVILIDPDTLQNNNVDVDNKEEDVKAQGGLKCFLSNLNIGNDYDINIINFCPGMGELDYIFTSGRFYTFKCDKGQQNLVIIHNNNFFYWLPNIKCLSKKSAIHSVNILNNVKNLLNSNDDSKNRKINISFTSNSIGITNMIYQLEELAKLNINGTDCHISEICLYNIPIDIWFFTMKQEETANRLVNVLCDLIQQGFIDDKFKKVKLVLCSPDEKDLYHNIRFSSKFLKKIMNDIKNTKITVDGRERSLREFINFVLREKSNDETEETEEREENIYNINFRKIDSYNSSIYQKNFIQLHNLVADINNNNLSEEINGHG